MSIEETGPTSAMYSGMLSFMGAPFIDLQALRADSGKESAESRLKPFNNSIIVLGLPFDTATSNRPGARFGPRAIRQASKMLSWQKCYPFEGDLYNSHGKGESRVFDAGDVSFDYGSQPSFAENLDKAVSNILEAGAKPLCIGGDHSTSYPILKTLQRKRRYLLENAGKIALVQFDAHSDTWEDEIADNASKRVDHGTGFYHAVKEGIIDTKKSVQIGIRTGNPENFGIKQIDSYEAMSLSAGDLADRILERVGDAPAYLSFDIDCLDPAYAPGTGTPAAAGLSSMQVLACLRELGAINWLGADLVELAPAYDVAEITALAAANILAYEGYLLAG